RAAWVPDGPAAQRSRAERADLAVLPLADLLRRKAEGREGGRRRAAEAAAAGRRPRTAEGSADAGARSGLDAARDRRADVPQHAAGGAACGRRPDAAAGLRSLRPRSRRRAPPAA